MKDKLIVILGPTAVGKTDLSIELAKKLATEIISGDSMLVYRGFDIGSAKPGLKERQGIKHHLIDILDPAQNFAVTDFVIRAKKIIHELNEQGKIPVLVVLGFISRHCWKDMNLMLPKNILNIGII